jgi:hypothetical protein
LFVITSKTPFSELNNPPFLIATTLGTVTVFALALLVGRVVGGLTLRQATLAGLLQVKTRPGSSRRPLPC